MSEKDIDLMAVKDKFDKYIEDFDFDQYSPFGHGTTKDRAKDIKEKGLLTRNDCKDEKIKQCNIWSQYGFYDNKSESNKTYFETCMESMNIGINACRKAYKTDTGKYPYKYEKETGRNFDEDMCQYFKIKDIEKYKDKLDIDEDSAYRPKCIKKFYSDNGFEKGGCGESTYSRLPETLTDFYDLLFAYGDEELIHNAIDKTPQVLFSISDWGTSSISGSIPPEDLKEMKVSDYLKEKKDCRSFIGNKKIKDHGLDSIKRESKYPHLDYFRDKSTENREPLKEWIKSHKNEYIKRLSGEGL